MNRKLGKFRISNRLIEKDPELCRLALDGVIVVRAECLWHCDAIEYIGLHEDFAELPAGQIVPDYVAVITAGDDENPPARTWSVE